MALTKQTVIDRIEIMEDGSFQVRFARYILEDGVRATDPRYMRKVFHPGEDVSNEVLRIRKIAQAEWTPEVIAAYEAARVKPGG